VVYGGNIKDVLVVGDFGGWHKIQPAIVPYNGGFWWPTKNLLHKCDVVTYGGNVADVIDVGDYGSWQKLHPAIPPWQKVHNTGCMISNEINAFWFLVRICLY